MSKAFQLMIDNCQTEYYIEVDEDMVLFPTAIETLYTSIKAAAKNVSIVAFKLLDVHLNFEIYGVKIYKHSVLRNYPYDLTSMSCEVEQIDRMKKNGFITHLVEKVVGHHAPQWSQEGIFERYKNLMDKFKTFKYVWLESLPSKLFNIFKSQPTEQNLYAMLGAYTSIMTDNIQTGEKNFHYRDIALEKMRSFIMQPTSANLYLTTKCNFNCKFCYRHSGEIESAPDMSINTVRFLLDRLPSIKGVCCAGYGEPFMSDNLYGILQLLKEQNKIIGLITNGSLVAEKFHIIKSFTPNYISFSLNAPNATIHQQINGTNVFDKVLAGIKMCVDANMQVFCSYVCSKDNIQHIPEFLKLVKSLNVKTVHLLNLLPHLASSYDDQSFWNQVLTIDNKPLIDQIKQLPEADIVKVYPTLIKYNEIRRGCKIPWTTIGIDGNGSISICGSVYAPKKANGLIGDNIFWQNDYATNLRNSLCGEMSDTCKMCFRNWDTKPEFKNVEYVVEKNTQVQVQSSRKLNVCKMIDQFGWAYYFVAKEQQKYSVHNITYTKLMSFIEEKISADVVYIHSPDINYKKITAFNSQIRQQGVKIIGGYGGESSLKYDDVDVIVAISIKHLRFLKSLYPDKPVVFMPESIDTQYFTPSIKPSNSAIRVGWAGCIRDVKRTHLLDQLNFNVVKQHDWGKEFFVDGRNLENMLNFYHSIDVLVLTSETECMPRVVLEAMACGLPVVATNVGCISLLLDNRWITPVFPENTVVANMNQKLQLLQDPNLRQSVGQRNREYVEKYFSWAANQKLWDKMFELTADSKFDDVITLSNQFLQSLPNFSNTDLVQEHKIKEAEILSQDQTNQLNQLAPQHQVSQSIPVLQTKPKVVTKIRPVFISYYTINTGYEKEYKKLEDSLKKFNLDHDIQGIPTQGSWFNNCFYRSIFVKDMLQKHKRAVIWVDCDAIIQQNPVLFETLGDYDFAYHLHKRKNNSFELLGGTMFFNYTKNAVALMNTWRKRVDANPTMYRLDQSYLHEAVGDVPGIQIYHLPATYCQIFDLMKDEGKPVIEHFQASRRYKRDQNLLK
ncbi:MAG: radical SAM protein [Nitrosarchaeum sp.]|nr:radical SAM protein [Nitrosarchaeum sp.]